jgi:hypothetical protein
MKPVTRLPAPVAAELIVILTFVIVALPPPERIRFLLFGIVTDALQVAVPLTLMRSPEDAFEMQVPTELESAVEVQVGEDPVQAPKTRTTRRIGMRTRCAEARAGGTPTRLSILGFRFDISTLHRGRALKAFLDTHCSTHDSFGP